MKKTVSPIIMFIISILVLGITAISLTKIADIISNNEKITREHYEFVYWFFRVVTALAASAISISIPGMLKVSYNSNGIAIDNVNNQPMTLSDKEPTIIAGGAIAVFVLVYLFNPIN